jgi:hypothetical protein
MSPMIYLFLLQQRLKLASQIIFDSIKMPNFFPVSFERLSVTLMLLLLLFLLLIYRRNPGYF